MLNKFFREAAKSWRYDALKGADMGECPISIQRRSTLQQKAGKGAGRIYETCHKAI